MTCEEFRRLVNGTHPADVTRAVRAVANRHMDGCEECFRWVLGPLAPLAHLGRGVLADLAYASAVAKDPQRAAEVDAMTRADNQDPEYRDVRYGEGE